MDVSVSQVGEATGNFTKQPSVYDRGSWLHCAKHLAWLGQGDLLQVPWCKRFHGMVVVINLWSGFGCALYALLAAVNRVIALTTEHSDDGTGALLSAFPAAVHLKRVEDVHAEMLQPLLRRRSVSVILVGGKILATFPRHINHINWIDLSKI